MSLMLACVAFFKVHGNTLPHLLHAPGILGNLTGLPLVKKTGEEKLEGRGVAQSGHLVTYDEPHVTQKLSAMGPDWLYIRCPFWHSL